MVPGLSMLPVSCWSSILAYLTTRDMRNLLLVSRSIKDIVQRYLYHELTLTEWASSGARIAEAIQHGIVSDAACECMEVLRVQFTSIEEISEAVRLCLEIQPRLPNVRSLCIEAHKTEDALSVLNLLIQRYAYCTTVNVVARAPSEGQLALAQQTLPYITTLQIPSLLRHETSFLARVSDLELEEVIPDGSTFPYLGQRGLVFDRLAVSYASYVDLGSPPSVQLELRLGPEDEQVIVDDSGCDVLKLTASRDLPQITPKLHLPSLRVLILCNIAPLPTINLLEFTRLDTLEFLSVAPVTLPALQALTNKAHLPSFRLLFVLVSRASFLSDSQFMRKRETRRIVEWLQMLAAQYPVDVRDFSWLLRQDIYFSDGLWCLTAQTRYSKYLPLVAPPPLEAYKTA